MERITRIVLIMGLMTGAWGCGDDDVEDGADVDSDTESDADTASQTDTDADTDTGDAVWCDETSGLCWQNLPPFPFDTNTNCEELVHGGYSDWRLPDIVELISLLRGCVEGNATGDATSSTCEMIPEGCPETSDCEDTSDCGACSALQGPSPGGCYWDPALGGSCSTYRSSSGSQYGGWYLEFFNGKVFRYEKPVTSGVRCVRNHGS